MIPRSDQRQVAHRLFQFDTDHEALPPDCQHVRVVCQFGAQAFQQPCALHPRIRQQALFFDDVQHRAADPAGQRIATESAAMAARGEQVGRAATGQAGADRHAIAQAFGKGHDIGHDAFVLKGEPLPGAADAGLDFIEHQQPRVAIAQVAQGLEITRRCDLYAAFALNRLDQNRHDARAVFALYLLQRGEIAERHFDEVPRQFVEAKPHRRAIAGGQRAEGAAMKRVGHDHHQRLFDAFTPAVQTRQFQRRFVRFGAGVVEERALHARQHRQPFGQLLLPVDAVQV